jgi:hypothetical protein
MLFTLKGWRVPLHAAAPALIIVFLAGSRARAGDGESAGVEIKTKQGAVLIFPDGTPWGVTLHSLGAKDLVFKRNGGPFPNVVTWPAAKVKEVHTAQDVLVYNGEKKVFESDLVRYRYDPAKGEFKPCEAAAKVLPVYEPAAIVMTNGTVYRCRLSAAAPGKLDLALRKDSLEPPVSTRIDRIETGQGVFRLVPPDKEESGVQFTDHLTLRKRLLDAIAAEKDAKRRKEKEEELAEFQMKAKLITDWLRSVERIAELEYKRDAGR